MKNLVNPIFSIQSNQEFLDLALAVFQYQAQYNLVYKQYIHLLGINPKKVNQIQEIPFLPIELFKHFPITTNESHKKAEKVFESSGTTGQKTSQHYVSDLAVYRQSIAQGFKQFYGSFKDYQIFALLPSYAERSNSSLIAMVDFWFTQANLPANYYLYNHQKLYDDLMRAQQHNKPILLIGVAFALLDFAMNFPCDLSQCILIETGGMKGRKKEIIREDLHLILQQQLNPKRIDSEYGMTELLTQAYAQGSVDFVCPNWMRVLARDVYDPLQLIDDKKTGGINIIDLANVNSCSFIATDDLGVTKPNGSFQILGRFDHSDVRGCSLLLS